MSTPDLFANPNLQAAKAALTPEQREKYAKIGENLYADLDNTGKFDPLEKRLKQASAYIIEGIKAGLLPKELSKDELRVLEEVLGKTWYESYGYTEKDLN